MEVIRKKIDLFVSLTGLHLNATDNIYLCSSVLSNTEFDIGYHGNRTAAQPPCRSEKL